MIVVDIQIASSAQSIPSEEDFNIWVNAAIKHPLIALESTEKEVSIRIVDADESQQLNHQYRKKNQPTNVLSFTAEFPDGINIPFLGDLVICASVVEQEAQAQKKTIDAHWAHMVVHGTLHLLGYDHIEDGEAETMEALETAILQSLNYPCPYTVETRE